MCVQRSIPPKNDFQENIKNTPKTCSVKELFEKYVKSLINLSNILAILYHKQTYKGGHF